MARKDSTMNNDVFTDAFNAVNPQGALSIRALIKYVPTNGNHKHYTVHTMERVFGVDSIQAYNLVKDARGLNPDLELRGRLVIDL